MTEGIDAPRLLRDPKQVEARFKMLTEPHVAPLTKFATELTVRGFGEVPYFDPWDGGIQAEALFLFEKPGPGAHKSGFISRNNDDQTAKNIFDFMKVAGLPRKRVCIWNIVPGWNGTVALTGQQVRRGAATVTELLSLLPNIRVIVLVGRQAQHAFPDEIRGKPILMSAHPSNRVRNTNPELWAAIPNVWSQAKQHFRM